MTLTDLVGLHRIKAPSPTNEKGCIFKTSEQQEMML